MSKLDLSSFNSLFETNKSFEITAEQYEKMVGKPLPSTIRYIQFGSPLAKMAKEKGYKITVDDRPIIQRVIAFRRAEE